MERLFMFNYLEAPNVLSREEYVKFPRRLFLAGGITNVVDWRKYTTSQLSDLDILVINPRRNNFEDFKKLSGFSESEKQIFWENDHLRLSNQIMFWFSNETLQPIALFELAKILTNAAWTNPNLRQSIFVGIHPDYLRRFDLLVQIPLVLQGIEVVDTIDKLIQQVKNYNRMLDIIEKRDNRGNYH